jgi:beta-phosphoglucomutase-like phosphatase (HAD superfamily)
MRSIILTSFGIRTITPSHCSTPFDNVNEFYIFKQCPNDKSYSLSFLTRLHRMNLEPYSSMAKESAAIGVQAASSAGIQCIIVLNVISLIISHFKQAIFEEMIFKQKRSVNSLLQSWCK